MSRNKENYPLNSPRPNDSLLTSSKQLASSEFFTDSLLDATQSSSRIPSPNPQKPPLTKARRARTSRNARNVQPPPLRASISEGLVSRSRQMSWQPTTPPRIETHVPRARTNSLTTPPGSKGGLPYPSPFSSISSPPPQDLTDAYRQIEDDEELAQTERELSSDGSNISEAEHAKPIRLTHRSQSESPLRSHPTFLQSPTASTPSRSLSELSKRGKLVDRTETLSEASGLSFLKEMTDQNLAAALTPHVSETARDKARLRAGWSENSKPVAFKKAQAPSKEFLRGESLLPTRAAAFSKALKPLPNFATNSDRHAKYRNEAQSKPFGYSTKPENSAAQRDDDNEQKGSLRVNDRVERKFKFSTNHGFPQHRPALTEKNLEQQNRGEINGDQILRSQSSAPSLASDRSTNDARVLRLGKQTTSVHSSRLPQLRKPPIEQTPVVHEPSQIDWAAVAADIPAPSVEITPGDESKEVTQLPPSETVSPEKSRRWENDFTGQSFQVSESPPVRQRPIVQEQARDREIQGLAKQAVTTNRLSEIRERQSQESLRGSSRSPAPRASSHQLDARPHSVSTERDSMEATGEPVPNTPVVVYKSSSNSDGERISTTPSLMNSNLDRSKSHDHLQRLARAVSTTPRSSPLPPTLSSNHEERAPQVDKSLSNNVESRKECQDALSSEARSSVQATVENTPKVVGAWTDTILPDTVKIVRQARGDTAYAQTPYVSAGGWIETPAPVEAKRVTGSIPTIVEEVPEDLVAGIVRNETGDESTKKQTPEKLEAVKLPQALLQETEQPKSALAAILDQQKNRLVAHDGPGAVREDTLNLGNDTIESLQGLLGLDENDMTTLSRLSQLDDETDPLRQNQAKSEFLERLGVRIDRLRQKQTDTANGISKIERQVSYPVQQSIKTTTPQQLLAETICPGCNQQTFQHHFHPNSKSRHFPHASFNLSLPIPLLFHSRTSDQWIPRPTLIGTVAFTIALWYVVENTMCELYCRPAYTDFYIWPAQREPEFPFVLPTMLVRWTRLNGLGLSSLIMWIWSFIVGTFRAIWRVFTMAAGWSDGFAADKPASRIVEKVLETVTSVAAAAAAEATGFDLSMNDDEYI